MKFTEKLLNCVFNKTRRVDNELHIMKFLAYNPWIKDRRTLIDNFETACKIAGKNNIDEMAYIMYNDQINVIENRDIPLKVCREYVETLFIDRSLKGRSMEEEALLWLRGTSGNYDWKKASDHLDVNYNVDIIGRKDGKIVYIQVKPESYKNADIDSRNVNTVKEQRLGHKIHYIYYDRNEHFSV